MQLSVPSDRQAFTRDAYGDALAELGARRPEVVVLDADLSGSTKTSVFGKKFPERFFNVGVSEADLMCTASGLARSGKIPYASTFAVFGAGKAWEMIRQAIAYPGLRVRIVLSHAGVTVGEDGASHQMLEDLALMRALPGMTVIVPADAAETRQAVLGTVDVPGPVYIRLSRNKTPVFLPDSYEFRLGRATVLRDGSDVSLIACGQLVYPALLAADLLQRDGIRARVLNMSTLKPLDREAVQACAQETGRIVTLEEHNIYGGLAEAVARALVETHPAPLHAIAVQDRFGLSGTADELLDYFGFTPQKIADETRKFLKATPA
ncbi:MAG: transketolase family protein [Nitrospirae bacterium]|nr:transketolase family protein [Nitrospirota bacterium]